MNGPQHFPTLASPARLRGHRLKNRISFGPHTVNVGEDGVPSPAHVAYYEARAAGGAAMIVVEPMPVHRTAVYVRSDFTPGDDAIIEPTRAIADAVRRHGAVILQQLYHLGSAGDIDNSLAPYWSPSGYPGLLDPWGSHPMRAHEIEEVIDGFIAAALRVRKAGLDGVDVLCGYSSLIDQFWSPLTNARTDEWGGSFDNRMRFARRVLSGIRQACGDEFIVGIKITHPEPDGGLTLEDKLAIVATLDEESLVDYVSVGRGSLLSRTKFNTPSFHFPMREMEPVAAALKRRLGRALVILEARVKTPAAGEEVLSRGSADIVAYVRSQIADPHFAAKATGGRPEDIRPCISCNQLCIGRRARDYGISCLVNPTAGRELRFTGEAPAPAPRSLHVLVVGGGPGGMEAARVAALRGHKVTLAERSNELGGQFRLAAGQPERGEISEFLNWQERQLEAHGVDVRLRSEMTAETILALGADAIVLATGSVPNRTGFQRALPAQRRLPGVDSDDVCTIHDVLDGSVVPGHRVLLLDDINGWPPASLTALHLAQLRHEVVLVTAAAHAAAQLDHSGVGPTTRSRFLEFGVETRTGAALLSWADKVATIRDFAWDSEEKREFDTLVLALPNLPNDGLYDELLGNGLRPHLIGDAMAARTAAMAIQEGRETAAAL